MASQEQILLLKRTIRKDERVLRLKDAFRSLPEYRMNFQVLHEELEVMMNTRPLRSLQRKKNFLENIVESMMTDQQYRTRITEILLACVKTEKNLARSLSQIKDYLKTRYYTQIYSVFRAKADRDSFIDHVLSQYSMYIDKVDELKQRCNLCISDIDKAGYMFKGLLESLQIGSKQREY